MSTIDLFDTKMTLQTTQTHTTIPPGVQMYKRYFYFGHLYLCNTTFLPNCVLLGGSKGFILFKVVLKFNILETKLFPDSDSDIIAESFSPTGQTLCYLSVISSCYQKCWDYVNFHPSLLNCWI